MGITVIDSIMGAGKTSWAIQEINEHPEESYIYCTPFLDEVSRIKDASEKKFYEPYYNGGRKIDDFNKLLLDGKNIALTHSTFSNANVDTMEYLSNGNYCLILDEVLDILVDFNDVANERISKADIKMLFKENFISVDAYGKVTWLKDSYPGSKYYNVERIAKNGSLFYLDGAMLVWQFPPQIFAMFKSVYVLTYLFEGSLLKPYFEYHNLHYEKSTVDKLENGKYTLVDWHDDKSQREKYLELVDILDDSRMNNFNASALSKSWYLKQNRSELSVLKKNLTNYFRNITKAKSESILWTCPKDYRSELKGAGYNVVRQMTKEEKKLPTSEREKQEKRLKCFVPCNARATNDYADRSVLAYMFNMYANPYVKRYFSNKNKADGTNTEVNQDYLALSCLLQWVWRSRIRKGEPIKIYIPSTRMRRLFVEWLHGKV